MKQKIDKPDTKTGRLAELFQEFWTLDTAVGCLLFIGLPVLIVVAIIMSACEQAKIQKAVNTIPAEQRQPMIEIPIERTVCVKPAEGYCLEYRTNRIRTP